MTQDQKDSSRDIRILADITKARLYQEEMTCEEAFRLVEEFKSLVLRMAPGKDGAFEIIYRPRFNRIIEERYGVKCLGAKPQVLSLFGEEVELHKGVRNTDAPDHEPHDAD
jgi:hypothetical protein